MPKLTIYRGTHQIGGCCTEIIYKGERILMDLGANLPDCDSPIQDDELVSRVFDGRPAAGLLFTHPHGDHYGLYKKVPTDIPMYMGAMAKEILKVLTSRLDYISEEKGLPVIERMRIYQAGKPIDAFEHFRVTPFYVDHSAPDAHMFYVEAGGKKILFTGDFRDHGIIGEQNRLWRVLEKYVPKEIDLLITEGTMLGRESVTGKSSVVETEKELGVRAGELFRQHKYNFVLVSSTNLDSIMEFYHNTPPGMHFVCDAYQAEVILTAMCEMEKKGFFSMYRAGAIIYVLNGERKWSHLRKLGQSLKRTVEIAPVQPQNMEKYGFVMLVRKNSNPNKVKKSIFEEMRDEYYPKDGQIIYSMWDGYLKPEHADHALLDYIGNRRPVHLHTSGHAYVETIARLINAVQPKKIVLMHTEVPQAFLSNPLLMPYGDRVHVLTDGESFPLNELDL